MIVVGVKAQDMTSTPLTLEAVEAGTINIVNPNLLTIEYNKNGEGWTAASNNPISIGVAAGDQVQLRGDNQAYCLMTEFGENPTQITATNDIYVYGNVMSLISSIGFATLTTLPVVGGSGPYDSDNTFAYLFTTSGEYLDPVINTTIRNHPTKDIVLPALNVTRCGYMYMFARCQNLTRAPELPATELGWGCYHQMFCSTAIERAPVLAAATVPHEGYSSMFDQCANLNYVKCLATDISAQGSTGFWLNGVAATGTFVKADGMDDWTVGPQDEWGSIHGIPTGWTVKNASEEVASMNETPLTIEATEDATTVTITNPLALTIEYSTDGGTSWISANNATITISGINSGKTVLLRGDNAAYSSDGTAANSMGITADKDYYLYGNMMSLVSSTGFATLTTLTGNYAFARLFRNNSHLKSHATKDLVLPATTLSPNCYRYTFQNCSGLTKAPELPATTMTEGCYFATFIGCTSLTTPPELPSTALAAGCYTGMFANSGLVTPPVLPATDLTDRCYYQMFYGCTALTAAPALPALTVPRSGYNQMFYNCSSLTETPALPATTIYGYSYNMMFRGCTGLTASPALPVTTMIDEDGMQGMFYDCTNLVTAGDLAVTTLGSSYSCSWMFHGCTSLTKAPKLPATTLTSYCYNRMFDECTSLVTAPELPATNLAELCYNDMFWNCTALKNPPVLPATKLVPYCYTMMFFGCSSLEKAPDLIAPTLEGNCYEHMFMNCTSLNYVKCLATDLGDETATDGWMTNVSATGTFVKAPGVDWSVKGTTEGTDFDDPSKPCTFVHGIPAGWTVETSPIVYAHLNSDGEGNYWATFYNESAGFTADATTSVYTAKVSSGKEKVELTAVDDKTIPAGNAVVLKSSAATATMTYDVATTGTLADNELLASATDITTPANTYMLTKGTSGVGFYHWTGTDIPANRGYLIISGAGAREFVPIDGMATGISEMSDVRRKTDDAYYDLNGRRVLYPTKGIYVRNGKKIIFK
ncbi:MAG: leucine-rich repeat protein [Prevotella sp.]|nr:leucine-rich repeat protein [Prevotella sp.]